MGHRNVYRLDYIQDIFTVKWLAAALLVTVLCFCSRFYDAFTGQEMLLIRAFFQYTGEELLTVNGLLSSSRSWLPSPGLTVSWSSGQGGATI